MKKVAKISTLICTLALVLVVMFALSACGAGTTYKYSSVSIDMGGYGSNDSLTSVYDTMMKDSTITVSDKEILWTISDAKNTMTVTKDGDKYVLGGEYTEQMKTAFSSMGGAGTVSNYEMYGKDTEGGFDIVMSMTVTISVPGTSPISNSTNITFHFVK